MSFVVEFICLSFFLFIVLFIICVFTFFEAGFIFVPVYCLNLIFNFYDDMLYSSFYKVLLLANLIALGYQALCTVFGELKKRWFKDEN